MPLTAYGVHNILSGRGVDGWVTEQFESWWETLTEDERVSVDGMIRVLETHGPSLGAPYSEEIHGSRYIQLYQLRVPHQDQVICVLYICDVWREALVLLTGALARDTEEVCPPDQIALADSIYGNYVSRLARIRGGCFA